MDLAMEREILTRCAEDAESASRLLKQAAEEEAVVSRGYDIDEARHYLRLVEARLMGWAEQG